MKPLPPLAEPGRKPKNYWIPISLVAAGVLLLVVRHRLIESRYFRSELAVDLSPNVLAAILAYLAVRVFLDERGLGLVTQVADQLREIVRPGTAAVSSVDAGYRGDLMEYWLRSATEIVVITRWLTVPTAACIDFFAQVESCRLDPRPRDMLEP